MHDTKTQFILITVLLTVFLASAAAAQSDALVWDRFRLRPEIDLSQAYTDNVFLSETDEEGEYITSVLPKFDFDFALAPDNFITLFYNGDFRYYSEYDNFTDSYHLGGLSWELLTKKGSKFEIGTRYQDAAFQPYSPTDRSRDFTQWEAFGNALFRLGAASELGFRYDHASRRMDDSRDEIDDFDIDGVALTFYYRRFPASSFLLEYAYDRGDYEDLGGPSTDSATHTLFGGIRWDPTSRLSGFFKAGYSKTDFEDVPDFSGYAMDVDLTYRFSDITTVILSARRDVSRSTRSERETGDYRITLGGRLSILYRRWEKLLFRVNFEYVNYDFESGNAAEGQREDDFYGAAFLTEYRFLDPFSFYFQYRYRRNDSNLDPVDYTENRVEVGLRFAL